MTTIDIGDSTKTQRVAAATEWLSYDSAMCLREIRNLGIDGAAEHGLHLYEQDDQHSAIEITVEDMRAAYLWILAECRRTESHEDLVAEAQARIDLDSHPADKLANYTHVPARDLDRLPPGTEPADELVAEARRVGGEVRWLREWARPVVAVKVAGRWVARI